MKLVLLSALMLLSKLTLHASDFNAIVLEQIRKMPEGGGYATTREAHQALNSAVAVSPLGLRVESSKAQPSYCSGATYLLFLKTLAAAEKQGFCPPGTSSSENLLPKAMPDGVGIWGRWNANGPGTARLFHELGLGKNFIEQQARRLWRKKRAEVEGGRSYFLPLRKPVEHSARSHHAEKRHLPREPAHPRILPQRGLAEVGCHGTLRPAFTAAASDSPGTDK
ncbi:MAG: hypothetical protein NTZ08_09895 [Verrucomicrobia bacterium]|nr:hypothetical protein [Verrucomicrobiota bacterium]